MFLKWLPWRPIARRIAKAHGFLDPVSVLARLERIAQPSEVSTPMELLRAGLVFHSRGLINTKVIQHNLDWVWPWWVQRQFDPEDESFVPRAFSATHVNLTHRNWTAVGTPGSAALPIVDPRGLLTPLFDGWSIDAWVLTDSGEELLPSRAEHAEQRLTTEGDSSAVRTDTAAGNLRLVTVADVHCINERPVCVLNCRAQADQPGWLVLALRPFNPEGVSFVSKVSLIDEGKCWRINGKRRATFDRPVDRHTTSTYSAGDVYPRPAEREPSDGCACDVGLATAAAMYRLDERGAGQAELRIDLTPERKAAKSRSACVCHTWRDELDGLCELDVPDARFARLYRAAVRTLSLLTCDETVPGPYTYNRFWFRDAAMMLHAMLCIGHTHRVLRVLDGFPDRQRVDGYFHSQDGEWDSNGEALWILRRYCALTGSAPPEHWRRPVLAGARWIRRKRCDKNSQELHAGLMPAGFSAEHLGNNDYYYWDDFWSAAADLCRLWQRDDRAGEFDADAESMLAAVDRSLRDSGHIRRHPGIPASPYRRMDAGAVGSVVAGYPLSLWPARDERRVLERHEVGERAHFPGVCEGDDLVDAYHAADAFVFASETETQGVVLIEAMAAGCPVIALDAPGARDVVRDGENGYLVGRRSEQAFADAVERLAGADDQRRQAMSECATQSADQFDTERCVDRMIEVYRDVLASERRPRDIEASQWAGLLRSLKRGWSVWSNQITSAVEALLEHSGQGSEPSANGRRRRK